MTHQHAEPQDLAIFFSGRNEIQEGQNCHLGHREEEQAIGSLMRATCFCHDFETFVKASTAADEAARVSALRNCHQSRSTWDLFADDHHGRSHFDRSACHRPCKRADEDVRNSSRVGDLPDAARRGSVTLIDGLESSHDDTWPGCLRTSDCRMRAYCRSTDRGYAVAGLFGNHFHNRHSVSQVRLDAQRGSHREVVVARQGRAYFGCRWRFCSFGLGRV